MSSWAQDCSLLMCLLVLLSLVSVARSYLRIGIGCRDLVLVKSLEQLEEETLHCVSGNNPQTTCQNCPAKDTAIPASASSILLLSPREICWFQKHILSSSLCWKSHTTSFQRYRLIVSQMLLSPFSSILCWRAMHEYLTGSHSSWAVAAWGLWNSFSFLVLSTWKWNLVLSKAGLVWNNPVYCVHRPPCHPTSVFCLFQPAPSGRFLSCLSKKIQVRSVVLRPWT